MKAYLIYPVILSIGFFVTNRSGAQLLIASNMEDLNYPLSNYYQVGNSLYAGYETLAVSGQKIATSISPDTTAYLSSVSLPLTQILYTYKTNPVYPDPLWPFGDEYQHLNANTYEVGLFTNNEGHVGTLLEKAEVDVQKTFNWNDLNIFDWETGSFSERGFDYLPFTEVLFSNTTLLTAGDSYFLGIATASNDWGSSLWWNGDAPADTIISHTELTDPTPLHSDWNWLAPSSESATPRAYRIFGIPQGASVPEPPTYGALGVILLGLIVLIQRMTHSI